jgi:hypothetical protein
MIHYNVKEDTVLVLQIMGVISEEDLNMGSQSPLTINSASTNSRQDLENLPLPLSERLDL